MSAEPLFSVIMANYNNARFIEAAMESVRTQTYVNWELVIVDDASTDESCAIIQKLKSGDSRICYIQNSRNQGVGYSKRAAVEASRGEVVGVLDPDDVLEENALGRMAAAHAEYPEASLCWSEHWICDALLNPLDHSHSIFTGDSEMGYLEARPGDIHHFWTFKRKSYFDTEGFSANMRLGEDQDLFYRLEEAGSTRLVSLPLYRYRHHPSSISLEHRTAAAFAHHLVAMGAAIQRRRALLSKDAWELQRRAVLRHFIEFVEWGGTRIELGLVARVQRSMLGVVPAAKTVSLPGRALRYRVKRLFTEFGRGH